jgi:N6-L-threonylcarbamoyladenine synthase
MGLGFPGGPIVAKYAGEYSGTFRRIFPIPLLEADSLDFSFSGLKSAVRREIESRRAANAGILTESDLREIAFEFEQSIVSVLVAKIDRAAKKTGVATIMLAGGVSANDFLRCSLEKLAKRA